MLSPPVARSDDATESRTTIQAGLTFVSGMSDLQDKIEANNPSITTSTISPIGLSAAVYRRFADRWRLGGTVGPLILAFGDAGSFTILPLGVSVRYDVAPSERVSPYVRLGVEKALVTGDFVESGGAGFVAGLGFEFGKPGSMHWGVEAALRSLEVNVPGRPPASLQSAQPYKGSVTVYLAF